jgi:hypothetical protein
VLLSFVALLFVSLNCVVLVAVVCSSAREKPEKEIMAEIQSIVRQITASVTFLPMLEGACTFDLLVYTGSDTSVPQAWEESDPKFISGESDSVRLRSFTTKARCAHACVQFRNFVLTQQNPQPKQTDSQGRGNGCVPKAPVTHPLNE